MKDLQQSTLSARARTGDKSIAVRVRQGLFQVVRVTYAKGGKSTVSDVSQWCGLESACGVLDAMGMVR